MPQSRIFREGNLRRFGDGRSSRAKYLRRLRAELIAHLGQPTLVQEQLVDMAIADRFQLLCFEKRLADTGKLTPHERREMSAARTRFERTLLRLGVKAAAPAQLTARQIMGLDPMPPGMAP